MLVNINYNENGYDIYEQWYKTVSSDFCFCVFYDIPVNYD